MKLNLTIPDELYERYLNRFGSPTHYVMLKKAIEEFQDIPSNDRWFGVYGKDRQRIEQVFQTTVNTGAELAAHVEKMNRVSIQGEALTFDADELARLQEQATFHGKTLQQLVRDMVVEIKDQMLEKV